MTAKAAPGGTRAGATDSAASSSAFSGRAAALRPHLPAVGFRGVKLNVAGWAAVLVPGATVGAVVGALVGGSARRALRVALGGVAGAAAGLAAARLADEIRWRDTPVTLHIDEPDEALDVMQAVRAAGVQADMVRAPDRDPEEGALGYQVRYRARDERRVRAVLAAQHG